MTRDQAMPVMEAASHARCQDWNITVPVTDFGNNPVMLHRINAAGDHTEGFPLSRH